MSEDRSEGNGRDGPYGPDDSDPYLNHPDAEVRTVNRRLRDAERERSDKGPVSAEELKRNLDDLREELQERAAHGRPKRSG
jgi:hypothetical protein